MAYFAHSSDEPSKQWQALSDHLTQTAKEAARFADVFDAGEYAYICGILHDIGKYSDRFQQKLNGANIAVDHTSAGAQLAKAVYGEAFGKLLAYCIAGHHSGLLDHGTQASTEGTLLSRLSKAVEDYASYKYEITLPKQPNSFPIKSIDKTQQGFTISFFIRMLYSCLVDADFIDTANYMSIQSIIRGENISISALNSKFNSFLQTLGGSAKIINNRRTDILHQCLQAANLKQGLFSLTVPTGGGKTYSSLAFALNHAALHNLERIIYVIPYTSIIEQNAKIFKDKLFEECVLEHHSNYQYEKKDAENDEISENIQSIESKYKVASENWDIPIIVTTNVQFFESLFANRSSKCRKLHNIAKSVVIFDEAQMLPLDYLKPCLLAISELVYNYNTTAVLCTATPPSINRFLPDMLKPVEIIQNPKKIYEDFKKVEIIKRGLLEDDALVGELNNLNQVLCIVNTKRHAQEIYKGLVGNTFHLSTLMCPAHRKITINVIKSCLDNKTPCKVVSTQLIEAGVDIDFPVVYRSLAGLDSIIQSAGRCNREGTVPIAYVHVFETNSLAAKTRGYLDRTASVAGQILRKFQDPLSLDAIENYFNLLYDTEGENALDKKEILECFNEFSKKFEFDFKTAANRFKLIESDTYPILIPYDEKAKTLINELRFSKYPLSLLRKLQPYTVSVYEYQFKKIYNNLEVINDCFYALSRVEGNYDAMVGLVVPQDPKGEAIFA